MLGHWSADWWLRQPSTFVLLGVGASYSLNYFYAIWLVSIAIGRSIQLGSLAAIVLMLPMVLLAFPIGWLSDLIGRRAVLLGAVVCNVLVVMSPVLSRQMSAGWLLVALFVIGASNATWGSAGVAGVIDSVNERSSLSAHRHIVMMGYWIDMGKLAAAGVLVLAEIGNVIVVRIITALLLLMMLNGATRVGMATKRKAREVVTPNRSLWLLMFVFALALCLQELSGTQQAGMVAIGGIVSGHGTAVANLVWVVGALVGNAVLWIKAPLTARYIPGSFVVYAVGFGLLAVGGFWAILGTCLNGMSSALLWQSMRATVIRDFPEKYRGRFAGIVGAIENVAMALGTAIILHGAVIWGYGLVFVGSAALALVAIIPIAFTLRALASVSYET